MNPQNPALAHTVPSTEWPLPKAIIVVICLFFPVLGGSILYYAFRRSCPPAARFANRLSWAVFGAWFLIGFLAQGAGVVMQKFVKGAHDRHPHPAARP